MNSLRARIVLTLFLSIFIVVVMATATLFLFRKGHDVREQIEQAALVFEAIQLIAPLLDGEEKHDGPGGQRQAHQPAAQSIAPTSPSQGSDGDQHGRHDHLEEEAEGQRGVV